MIWILIIELLVLAPVCLVTVEILGDILRYRDLQRRLREERERRDGTR